MSRFNVNISPDAIVAQREQEFLKKTQNTFNLKNYLQARLGDNEDSKEITIRLLPFEPTSETPFHKIWMHQVKVNKEVSPSGWKRFPCPIKNHLGDKCPFCETSTQSRELAKTTINTVDKKNFEQIAMDNYPSAMWVVRCIETGHEEDGVKFWIFNHSKQNNGIYDKIYNIFKKRKERGRNIFDLNEGKDICLQLTKDNNGKTIINVNDEEDYTPLTDNVELGMSWINDSKKWNDVYTVKSYDYMSVVVEGGVPVWSPDKQTYVDKVEHKKEQEKEINANITPQTVDMTKGTTVNVNGNDLMAQADVTEKVFSQYTQPLKPQIEVEDDLPF